MADYPPEMTALPAWGVWRLEKRNGDPKGTKVPYRAAMPTVNAKTDTPEDWGSYAAAAAALDAARRTSRPAQGLAFRLNDSGFTGIDLDGCLNDDGPTPFAASILARFPPTFTEISQSGRGLHLFVRGQIRATVKTKEIELYSDKRYFAVTGNVYRNAPLLLADSQAALDALHDELRPVNPPEPRKIASRNGTSLSDGDLLETMVRSGNGAAILALWNGDTSAHGDDDSAADLALCRHLAFWTDRDPARMDSLFRRSRLYRDKWERDDYRHRTIGKAIAGTQEGYQPRSRNETTGYNTLPSVTSSPVAAARETIAERARRKPVLDPAALHGLAGEFVRVIEPHTESASVAILIQLLVCFGNAIGRSAHFKAESDRHYGNIFACLVGLSSKGRKGTSWGHVKRVFLMADAYWSTGCVTGGLSSGEGLVHAVRDEVIKHEKDKKTGQMTESVADPGVLDKRLLCMESEFASVLRQASREGNILSAVVRQAWDTGDIRTLTINSPTRATGAHISIIGHITDHELRETLTATDTSNGFANRFLWVLTERSKLLPFGGNLQDEDLCPLIPKLSDAITFARERAGLVDRDDAARDDWAAIYETLSEGRPGLAGSVTSRSEAQTMRLALLYALLDQSDVIGPEHLAAGLAVWKYADDSARYIFGSAIGNADADAIFAMLTEAGPNGVTRTQINDRFKGHRQTDKITAALSLLDGLNLARMEKTPTAGRAVETWYAVGDAEEAERAD